MLLEVKVKPGAGKDEVLSFRPPNFLEISLKAKPENNQANLSLCRFLAKLLNLKEDQVKILKGKTSRKKLVAIEGIEAEDFVKRLGL